MHAGDDIPGDAHAASTAWPRLIRSSTSWLAASISSAGLRLAQMRHARPGRAPIQVDHRHTLIPDRVSHAAQSDVDDGKFFLRKYH